MTSKKEKPNFTLQRGIGILVSVALGALVHFILNQYDLDILTVSYSSIFSIFVFYAIWSMIAKAIEKK